MTPPEIIPSMHAGLQMPDRRAFLLAAAFAPEAFAQAAHALPGFWNQPRWVWLKRPATGEEIRAVYWAQGQLVQSEYLRICWFLRDVRAKKSMYMSIVLLDMLYATSAWLAWHGMARPITTTSGARFAATNAMIEGAAKDSLHQEGRAHDGLIEGVSLESMVKLGAWLGGGGVGYYPAKKFCHWDDGRVRFWKG